MKIGVGFLIIALLSIATGAVEVSVSPGVLYESTAATIVLELNNVGGDVISEVALTTMLPITGVASYGGWQTSQGPDKVIWTGGTVESNVQSAVFALNIRAPESEHDRVLQGTVLIDGVPAANYSIKVLADKTGEIISNSITRQGTPSSSSTERVDVSFSEEEYVPLPAKEVSRPSPVPEENKEYVLLPPVEPRAALEMPTGLVAGSFEKIKTTKWMLLLFVIIIAGIYAYDHRPKKWVEMDELQRRLKK